MTVDVLAIASRWSFVRRRLLTSLTQLRDARRELREAIKEGANEDGLMALMALN